jgi:hypothetical protein
LIRGLPFCCGRKAGRSRVKPGMTIKRRKFRLAKGALGLERGKRSFQE